MQQFQDENTQHPSRKHKDNTPMTVKEIRDYDLERLRYFRDKGYAVEIIWERDWNALVNQRPEIKAYLSKQCAFTHWEKWLRQEDII